MMYVIRRTIPANTSEKDAVEVELPVFKGVIHYVRLDMHRGARGTARTVLLRHRHQIFPSNGSEYFALNGETFEFKDHYEIKASPSSLIFKMWNVDPYNRHEITWHVGILDSRFIEIVPKWIEVIRRMSEIFSAPRTQSKPRSV